MPGDDKFFLREIPEQQAVYVQFNETYDKPNQTLADFAGELFNLIEAKKYNRLILDIRRNFGGDHSFTLPLLSGIMGSKQINREGGLFVLIGPGTFSAAVLFTTDLELMTSAVFIGEPSGSPANHFGDSRKFKLPESGLTVRISSLYWQQGKPYDHRPWIHPDISVPLNWRDFASGVDPVLTAAYGHKPEASFRDQLLSEFNDGGVAAAMEFHRRFLNEPHHRWFQSQNLLHAAAKYLINHGDWNGAEMVVKECVRSYPKGAEGYLLLGRVLYGKRDIPAATAAVKTSLAFRPGHAPGAALLRRIQSLP